MELNSILYIVYSTTAITITIILALLFWVRRGAAGAKSMTLMMGSAALWGLCDFISDLISYNPDKIFWDNLSYIGVVTLPVAWFIFAMQYTKYEGNLKHKKMFLLFIIPSITLLLLFTNDFHHLMISEIDYIKEGQLTILSTTFGSWFWFHAAYSYLLFFLGTVLIVHKLVTLPKILRNQSVIILAAILVPLALNVLYTFKVAPSYPIDLTIFSFTFAGILCFIGMFRYRLFELIPAARNAVIEDMGSMVVVLDNQNHIIDINSAARNFFGIKSGDYIGEHVFDVLGRWSSYFIEYEHVEKTQEKISLDTENGIRYFDLRIMPLFDYRSKSTGRYFILYDITALEEAINNLEVSRKTAENANKAKSDFLATMSHEIRTPLNGIIGTTELLASTYHTEEEKGYLQTVESCAESLLDIINDILDFSKIEAGKMELEKTDFNLKSLMNTAVTPFLHQAKEKGIDFVCRTDDTIPQNLTGDPLRIKQVLINLIGNAFKFTEKGRVQVTAEKLGCEDNRVIVRFSVSDTGIGIPKDKINSLFRSFEQVDSSTTRKYGGTGLGLAIVKNLVCLMDGSINVESSEGEGSRFSFTAPFRISDNIEHIAITNSEINLRDKNISVLLADDNRVNQNLIKMLLEKEGVNVDIARNGKEVLVMTEEKKYDLILMDIMMPEMDGYEATMVIRKKEEGTKCHIPIIALTASATEEDKNKGLNAGMDDYLTKPLKSKTLYECLDRHICKNK